jgi:hypothetical protein
VSYWLELVSGCSQCINRDLSFIPPRLD